MNENEEKKAQKATYVVEILFRQNNTWQGNVTWNEGHVKSGFRSELELLRLLSDER